MPHADAVPPPPFSAEESLAVELRNTRLLRDLALRMVIGDNIEAVAKDLLDAAIQITGADAGTVQVLEEESDKFRVIAHRGLSDELVARFGLLDRGAQTSCGLALSSGKPLSLDFDDPSPDDPEGSRGLHLKEGLRSVRSTPLITRTGRVIGILSTHWRSHHRLDGRQLEFLDLLARQAADLLAHRQAEQALRESEARLAREVEDARTLQEISRCLMEESGGSGLYQCILDSAVSLTRADFGSLQMLRREDSKLDLLASSGFDAATVDVWNRVDADACMAGALALRTEQRYAVGEVATCELMRESPTARFYAAVGIRAVLYSPLVSRRGRIVGLLATHWRDPHEAGEHELRLLDVVARQAADFIERQHAEAELKQSEADYRTLFDSIDEGFCVIELLWDESGAPTDYRFLKVNPAFERQTGLESAVGKTMRQLAPGHEDHWFEIYGRVALSGEAVRFERPAGELGERWYDVYALRVGEPHQRQVAVVFNDITVRKKAVAELRQAHDELEERVELRTTELREQADQLRRLASELTLSEQRERTRMADTLHDHVQQLLVSAKMRCEGLRKKSDDGPRNELTEVVGLLGECLNSLRSLTVELSPPILNEGLAPVLEWLGSVWMKEKHQLAVHLELDWQAEAATYEIRSLVFLAVRELLFNVVKHSGVREAQVELIKESPALLRVTVKDAGQGFDPARLDTPVSPSLGLGLLTVRERIGMLGGKLEIRSSKGGGVEAVILAPRKPDSNPSEP